MHLANGGLILKGRFFFHGTTNSCGLMIGFLGNKKIKCNKMKINNNSRIVVLEGEINDEMYF